MGLADLLHGVADHVSLWPCILVLFWLWGRIDDYIAARSLARYRPFETPKDREPLHTTRDVSVVVPTVNTKPNFAGCLRLWIANNPLEILIVTFPEQRDHVQKLIQLALAGIDDIQCTTDHDANGEVTFKPIFRIDNNGSGPNPMSPSIRLLTSPRPGKRLQMCRGFLAARGSLIAVFDDHISVGPNWLAQMLPCFDSEPKQQKHSPPRPTVGAAGCAILPDIPVERRHPDVITPWEAMAVRAFWRRNPGMVAAYATSRWLWTLTGCSYVIRASIVRHPEFLAAYTTEGGGGLFSSFGNFFGLPNSRRQGSRSGGGGAGDKEPAGIDAGEDNFISRWLQRGGFEIAMQQFPATSTSTSNTSTGPRKKNTDSRRTLKRTWPAFRRQFFRWERSTIKHFWLSLVSVPAVWRDPWVARKTLERAMRVPITAVHVAAWAGTLFGGGGEGPGAATLGVGLLAWYLWDAAKGYAAFFEEYPYLARHVLAVVAMDYFYVVQDIWCCLTINDGSWTVEN